MKENKDTRKPKEALMFFFFILFCVIIVLILIASYIIESLPDNEYKLADSDCYMHLIRASDLYHHGQWYNSAQFRSNAPFEESIHWSRPFDVLLLAGAIPASLFVDFETALFWWGVVLSPVLFGLAMITLNWATRILLNKDGSFFAVLLFLFQAMIPYFIPGRPDHHGLLALFFILHIGFVLRLVAGPFQRSLCYWAGAISAMSIWISVESMVPVCITLVAFGILWGIGNKDLLQKSLHFTLALFIFCLLFLIMERPLNYLTMVKYDSISIVYAVILCFVFLFWMSTSILEAWMAPFRRRISRLIYGLLGCALIAFLIWLFFPKLYQGPLADMNPRLIAIWFNRTSEVQSFLSGSVSLGISVELIGNAMVSFAFLLYLIFHKKDTEHRNVWIYIMISGILLLSISLYQIRWAVYPYVIFSIVMAELLCRIWRDRTDSAVRWLLAIRNITLFFLFAIGFMCIGLVADLVFRKPPTGECFKQPPIAQICQYLNRQQKPTTESLQLLVNPFYAAEILYRTDYAVVTTANTYGQGILDTYDILTAETDDIAFEILKKHRTDMILLSPLSNEEIMFSEPSRTSTLYRRLCDGHVPSWLQRVELPEPLADDFLLFKVIYKPFSINLL